MSYTHRQSTAILVDTTAFTIAPGLIWVISTIIAAKLACDWVCVVYALGALLFFGVSLLSAVFWSSGRYHSRYDVDRFLANHIGDLTSRLLMRDFILGNTLLFYSAASVSNWCLDYDRRIVIWEGSDDTRHRYEQLASKGKTRNFWRKFKSILRNVTLRIALTATMQLIRWLLSLFKNS